MIYFREGLRNHPKMVRAGQLIGGGEIGRIIALGLYHEAIDYAREHATDGVVPAPLIERVRRLDARSLKPGTALTKVTLFELTETGDYRVHDYLDFNPTAVQVKEDRRQQRERKAAWRRLQKERQAAARAWRHHAAAPRQIPSSFGAVPAVSQRDHGGTSNVPAGHWRTPDVQDPCTTENKNETQRTRRVDSADCVENRPRLSREQRRALAREPADDGNRAVIGRIARLVIREGVGFADLLGAVQKRLDQLEIEYRHDPTLVTEACATEWFKHEHPELVEASS